MFDREALWISFYTKDGVKAAVKISVGGAFLVSTYLMHLFTLCCQVLMQSQESRKI